MRKYYQKTILNILNTLEESISEAEKVRSINLLADCQDSAIEIASIIEQLEGKGNITVQYIEDYCELLFLASQQLSNKDSDSNIFKKLKKQHIMIVNSVKHDIKIQLEIVFFPYKASMFDAFHSIWITAKEDPLCEPYVVPIPYYDKNEDGSFGKAYYEGGDFPDNVPVIDYKSYDIGTRQPDVIFIHNPYDNGNYVTSVHPDYYAERLRKFTELLVYSPYFVSFDVMNDTFAILPGTIFAHKILVQSDMLKKEYIKHYKSFEKENNIVNQFGKVEDKFISLGSPKIDVILNEKFANHYIPDEWLTLIKNSNGKNKKIILYNTSIAALLTYEEKLLHKMKYVFDCFKNNDEVVLLWRPHPLSLSTLKSMRPELVNEYAEIVENYCFQGFGIYDDSSNLQRAILLSDAYYGDYSSLIILYGMTGKPVMLQNVEETDISRKTMVSNFALDKEGKGWGYEYLDDGLYQLDFEKNIACYKAKSNTLMKINEIEKSRDVRYQKIHIVGDYIICIPLYVGTFFIYNHVTGTVIKKIINEKYNFKSYIDGGFGFISTVQYQNKIYCFGYLSKAVVIIDTINFELSYHTKIYEKIGLVLFTNDFVKYPLYISDSTENGKILLLMRHCKHLISYSLITEEVEYLASCPLLSKCSWATMDEKHVWFLTEKNDILFKWDYIENKITEYLFSNDGFLLPNGVEIISGIIDCGEYLLFFPFYYNTVLRFDKSIEKFSECKSFPVPEDEENKIRKYFLKQKNDGRKVYAFAEFDKTIYEFDKVTEEVVAHEFVTDREGDRLYFADYFDEIYDIAYETNVGNIAEFFAASIKGINEKRKSNFLEYSINKDGTAGQAIYEKIRNEVIR
ncbi:MAG: CDP-glycerol glycerophosphotransferase family protein [Lachnospiraceae bacterium]|nr:CDP-glycerol glycerophosphotransferase family protein [Lachnospiraceae bacterium]